MRLCCAAELDKLLRLSMGMANLNSWEVACQRLGRSLGCADVKIESWLLNKVFTAYLYTSICVQCIEHFGQLT